MGMLQHKFQVAESLHERNYAKVKFLTRVEQLVDVLLGVVIRSGGNGQIALEREHVFVLE